MLFDVLLDFRVPEPLTKKIIWQTLHAVDFCHQHNVCIFLLGLLISVIKGVSGSKSYVVVTPQTPTIVALV